jgi:thiamine-monophosphate kinase
VPPGDKIAGVTGSSEKIPCMRDEREITDRLRKLAVVPANSPVIKGIGDDCAIYRPRGSADDLLFTTDMFIEGVHFLRETHKPEVAGRKALVRSLSDIAAMSGTPRFCLISLCVPQWATTKWVDKFFDGILKMAAASGAIVAGGDLSHGESLFCDVMVCGAVPRGQALRRDTARPGDEIYVSGLLGGSSLGLDSSVGLEKMSGKARTRHLHPDPRLALGCFLRERLRATSAIDISDGLSLDLHRICLASGVDAAIIAPPCFPGATLDQALHGGEEYELIFTVPAGATVPDGFEGVRLTRIGEITRAFGSGGTILLNSKPLESLGYDHFRQPGTTTRRDRAV